MASSAMEEAVIVDLQTVLSNRLDADCLKISCSGTFIDKENGLIVTSGLILSPVLQMKPDLQDACYHRKLATFFSEHGVVLSESQFVSDNTYLSGQPLLNYIDSISDINVYIQKQRQQDEDVMSAASNIFYSKCLFSIGAGGKKHFSHLKQCIEPSESHNNDKSWIKMPAKLLLIWRCPSLANILDTVLVHGSGWSLTDDTKNETAIEEQTLKNILPFFVLLKAKPQSDFIDNCTSTKLQNKINQTLSPYLFASLGNNFYNNQSTLQMVIKVVSKVIESIFKMPQIWKRERHSDGNTQPSFIDQLNISRTPNSLSFEYLKRVCEELPRLKVGDQLCIMATPFGSLSPNVFINSISKGIVTNLAGENDVLLLTDARCVPGCEGGAIYAQSSSSKRQLIGLIIAPFCWRQNEWVGLTFGINLRPLLESLFIATGYNAELRNIENELNLTLMENGMSDIVDSIALIKVGSRWGSAVLLKLKQCVNKYLITCCHVIQENIGSTVTVHFHSQKPVMHKFSVEASVIYCTPKGRIYDIAILEVHPSYCKKLPRGIELSAKFAVEEGHVLAVGHGLFDDSMKLPASVTSGIISKILEKDGKQVLIQSTCAVHPGASGGALLNANSKEICGIIVCNTKDAICGASYPHINLSIPSTIILPILRDYLKSGDLKALNRLHDPDPIVACFWQLGYNQMGKLQCKL